MNQQLSAVAGILDRKGGLRVVVTQRWRMKFHVKKGEQIFIVPGLLVREPVPWDKIPFVIAEAHRHVNRTIAPSNHCGECTACCRDPFIRRDASFGSACVHCKPEGCRIYFNRPQQCRDFECHWLSSQKLNDKMPEELRPDRCGVMFTKDTVNGDPLLFEVHILPGREESEKREDVWKYINEMQAAGYKAKRIDFYLPDPTDT
jgi:Fe-S-cluster containining protein